MELAMKMLVILVMIAAFISVVHDVWWGQRS
jgi:hypothetical protein